MAFYHDIIPSHPLRGRDGDSKTGVKRGEDSEPYLTDLCIWYLMNKWQWWCNDESRMDSKEVSCAERKSLKENSLKERV